MATVRHILNALEGIAPKRYAFSFDKVGLQVGSPEQPVSKAVVSLDRSLAAVKFAREQGSQLLLSHHPLIFRPIESVDSRSHVGKTILHLIQCDISFIAAHTNWDSAIGGINDTLAEMLGLLDVKAFGTAAEVPQFKLVTTAPPENVEAIIDAASAAGAGVMGAYTRCAFTTEGHGTFLPGEDARPRIGERGGREVVDEVRIEMAVAPSAASAVMRALQVTHPYEEPLRDLYMLRNNPEQPAGRVGSLASPCTFEQLVALINETLETTSWAWGEPGKRIRKVAVVGGAADDEWMNAQRAGADVLITGEVKQHNAVEASESGMCIVAAGHYATEHPGCEALRKSMESAISEVEWVLYTPPKGFAGRPF